MPANVLEKLRRASQQLPGRRKSSASGPSFKPIDSDAEPRTLDHASFLGLPPEIRNQIYEQLALDTHLSLTPPKSRKRGAEPMGLLLASRQVYSEYRPLLLALAKMQIFVSDYNFGNVIRVLERLTENDVSHLLANENLWVCIRLAHVPSREDRKSLRAWHDYRAGNCAYFKSGSLSANRLRFKYDVEFSPLMRPPRPASRYPDGYAMKLDLLRAHIRLYTALDGEESPTGEIRRLREDLVEYANLLAELRGEGPHGGMEMASRSASIVSNSTAAPVRWP